MIINNLWKELRRECKIFNMDMECGVLNMECGVLNMECSMLNMECGVSNMECMRTVQY